MTEVTFGAPAPESTAFNRLRGRRIVITGAASGIGRATAQLFACEGASLALFDRDERGLAQSAQETGGHSFCVDITSEDELTKFAERAAAALGGIDGIVNAAGVMPYGPLLETPVDVWRRTLEVPTSSCRAPRRPSPGRSHPTFKSTTSRNPGREVLYMNVGGAAMEFTGAKCHFYHFRWESNARYAGSGRW